MKLMIREVRKKKRISQRQLGIKAKVARSYISELESCKNNPTASTL